jgi:STE24 endopeptidase
VNEDKATRYNRRKRQARIGSLVWNVALLAGLVLSGSSGALRSVAGLAAASAPPSVQSGLLVVVYAVLLILLVGAADLPLSLYSGFILERRYGLSNESLRAWLLDQGKSLVVELLFGAAAAGTVYFFIRRSPDLWWLPAGATFALFIVVLMNVAPVMLLPIFYRVKPLDRESLRVRLVALAERAGARVLGAYEWGMSEKTRTANAALAGLGGTRRILVSDTMLAEYSDEEIEIVLAHELAHHVHGDVWKTLVFESALLLAGFYLAARALEAFVAPAGLGGPDDVAGLPILVLAAGALSLVTLPVAHAASRAHERRADRFALELTNNPGAFISAMRRLAAQNLAEEHPSKLVQWLSYSHPPIRERIAAAEAFKAQQRCWGA